MSVSTVNKHSNLLQLESSLVAQRNMKHWLACGRHLTGVCTILHHCIIVQQRNNFDELLTVTQGAVRRMTHPKSKQLSSTFAAFTVERSWVDKKKPQKA